MANQHPRPPTPLGIEETGYDTPLLPASLGYDSARGTPSVFADVPMVQAEPITSGQATDLLQRLKRVGLELLAYEQIPKARHEDFHQVVSDAIYSLDYDNNHDLLENYENNVIGRLSKFVDILRQCVDALVSTNIPTKINLRRVLMLLCNDVVDILRGCFIMFLVFRDPLQIISFFKLLFDGTLSKRIMETLHSDIKRELEKTCSADHWSKLAPLLDIVLAQMSLKASVPWNDLVDFSRETDSSNWLVRLRLDLSLTKKGLAEDPSSTAITNQFLEMSANTITGNMLLQDIIQEFRDRRDILQMKDMQTFFRCAYGHLNHKDGEECFGLLRICPVCAEQVCESCYTLYINHNQRVPACPFCNQMVVIADIQNSTIKLLEPRSSKIHEHVWETFYDHQRLDKKRISALMDEYKKTRKSPASIGEKASENKPGETERESGSKGAGADNKTKKTEFAKSDHVIIMAERGSAVDQST